MTHVADVVAARLAAEDERAQRAEQYRQDARRQAVRQAASDYLVRWGRKPDLPKGRQGDPGECVFAAALGGMWDGQNWLLGADDECDSAYTLELPDEVQEFIERFDRGEYPDLILGG